MGYGYTSVCGECNHSEEFLVGIGMGYAPYRIIGFEQGEDMLSDLIDSKETVAHIRRLVAERSAVLRDDYGHATYRCEKCCTSHNRFFLHLDYEGGSFEVPYRCPKCESELARIIDDDDEEEDGVEIEVECEDRCPKCGKNSMQAHDFITWD